MATIALLGTLDTKLEEYLKLRDLVLKAGAKDVVLIDAGRQDVQHQHITITHEEMIQYAQRTETSSKKPDFQSATRGEIVGYLTKCAELCVRDLHTQRKIDGIISAGGSGGTTLATSAMRALPIGFPKIMISTVGSGDVSPFVGETDICMMYSIVDIAGWNGMLHKVFANGAGAIVGMARNTSDMPKREVSASQGALKTPKRRRIGITMFGVTTPCVDMIREQLANDYLDEVYVFHATGHGGKAMERLIGAGELDAAFDLTTTEICDHFMGGNMSAGPDRLQAGLKAGIPYVISVGACDMVNFGAKPTVPEKYQDRKLYEHNAAVTLMRTTPEECRQIGSFISDQISKHAKDPRKVKLILPGDGVSLISSEGQAFHDSEADKALLAAVTAKEGSAGYPDVIRMSEKINDPTFASAVVELLDSIKV